MRNFSKKLAFVLAAAMVFTAFAPAAKADAAEKMVMNRASQTLYVNEGVNDKGAETLPEGLYGNVQEYDFYVKNKPANYAKELKFAWESSDEKVATVDNKGLTKAVAVGTATITCTITDKATGDEVAEATAKVTVKANAADVVITNAEDYDNLPVPEDGVVDLNRAMYDENDNKTTKRGKVVTDYTRWIAEDADGEAVDATVVAIDQATGKFTFAADAPAGDYALYCQTYQSDKYNQKTAESEKVTVTVVETVKTFEVTQTTTTKFVVKFDTPVKALNANDVEVIRILDTAAGPYPYSQTVKSVKLAEDKMSATVEIFQIFSHGVNYTIKVKGYEDYTLTASNGKPVRMEIKAKDMNPSFVVYTNTPTELQYTLFDAKDVEVPLPSGEKVKLSLDKKNSQDANFSGGKLTIKKNTGYATIIGSYEGYKQDKETVGKFSQEMTFLVEDKPIVVPIDVSEYTLNKDKWGGDAVHSFKLNENPVIWFKLQQSDGDKGWEKYEGASSFKGANGKITFKALDPSVAVVDKTGKLTGIKAGVASFYVNYEYTDSNKEEQSYPFAEITVEVKDKSYVASVDMNTSSKTVGTSDADAKYHTASVYLLGYDQYDARCGLGSTSKVTVKCVSDYEEDDQKTLAGVLEKAFVANYNYSNADAVELKIDARKFREELAKIAVGEDTNGNTIYEMDTVENGEDTELEFEVTYKTNSGDLTTSFSITIQEPNLDIKTKNNDGSVKEYEAAGDSEDDEVVVAVSDASKDVLRNVTWNNSTKAAKSVSFYVNWMNNDVQIGTEAVEVYDAKTATAGAYQVKIFKNDEDITSKVNGKDIVVNGNVVTLNPSYVNPFGSRVQKAVSGGAVAYDVLGEGTYTVELYKWYVDDSGDLVDDSVAENDIVITVGDAGAYTTDIENLKSDTVKIKNAADPDKDDYDADDAELILKCFLIKDTDGTNVVKTDKDELEKNNIAYSDYFVDYKAVAGTDTVYVKEIVFYESVGNNEYVAYTVTIDTALVWAK